MAYTFTCNTTPTNGSLAMYSFIANLIAAGWTNVSDSDGTTYASGGGQVTSGASGAHGLANASAWVRLQAPAVSAQKRELTFQHSTTAGTHNLWRIKYSAANGFVGGSPAATQTPTATDQVVFWGGGTEAAPTMQQCLGSDGAYRFNTAAGGAAEKYSFYWLGSITGSGAVSVFFCMDALQAFDAADTDPAVFAGVNNGGPSNWILNVTTPPSTSWCGSWLGATSVIGNFLPTQPGQYGHDGTLDYLNPSGSGGGVSPFSAKDPVLPVFYSRYAGLAAPLGPKGWGILVLAPGKVRTNLDTVTVSTSNDHIYYDGFLLPWNGTTPTI